MNFERLKGFLREPGDTIGRYEVVRELARGGMAVIYEAHDTRLERPVAVKLLKEGNIERLRQEAQAAARLRHPHIVNVHEVGDDFIVMDLIAGRTLAEALPTMDLAERLRVLETVARTVDHAHAHGVIHRDLKPGNILIQPDGHVVLTDFGLAKILGQTELTLPGSVMGTPQYMAPEQVRGDEAGPAADVWALGVLLYEMVAGRRPFTAATALETHDRIIRAAPDPISGALGAIALEALEKNPARRHASAAAFADDVARARRGDPIRGSRWRPRLRRWAPILATLLGAALIGAIAVERHRRPDAAGADLVRLRAEEDATTHALARHPDDLSQLIARADVRERRANHTRLHGGNPLPDFAAAEADLSRALAVRPSDAEARLRRGRVRAQRAVYKVKYGVDPEGDLASASEDLEGAGEARIEARTWRANVLFQQGLWRLQQGRDGRASFEAAEADLTPASDADRLMRRGRVRAYLGRFAEADRDFADAIARLPAGVWAWTWRGMARATAGDLATADTYLTEAIHRDRSHTEAWEQRGYVRLARGDREGAIADWREAMRLDPALEPQLQPRIQQAHQP